MPGDLAVAHVILIVLLILALGAEEHDEHGRWHR